MRFLSIFRTTESNTPPSPEEMAAMGQLIEEMTARGHLIATEGCLPSALGARVRRSGEQVTVTDGPFTEAKELVAGFALLEAESKEQAVELTRRFLDVAGDGECEIRQVYEGGEGCVDLSLQSAEPALAQA
ncbi:MAG TPA: YciI family protein [Longimicrobiaceae bacterium]